MPEKPPLVLAVEHALDGPARWVRYDPRVAAPAAFVPRVQPETESPFAPPAPSPREELDDAPPLVAAIEEALGTEVEMLRYLPSINPVAPAMPGPAPVPIRARAAPPDKPAPEDEALVAAVEAAIADAVLWLQYAPAVGEMRLISPRVA